VELPTLISDLIAAQNRFDSEAYANTFSDDALISYKDKTYHGRKEIRLWNAWSNAKNKIKLKPLDASLDNGKISVTNECIRNL
jgi:ketosteroid isomerase-like protein